MKNNEPTIPLSPEEFRRIRTEKLEAFVEEADKEAAKEEERADYEKQLDEKEQELCNISEELMAAVDKISNAEAAQRRAEHELSVSEQNTCDWIKNYNDLEEKHTALEELLKVREERVETWKDAYKRTEDQYNSVRAIADEALKAAELWRKLAESAELERATSAPPVKITWRQSLAVLFGRVKL